jgi:hypothetical protein
MHNTVRMHSRTNRTSANGQEAQGARPQGHTSDAIFRLRPLPVTTSERKEFSSQEYRTNRSKHTDIHITETKTVSLFSCQACERTRSDAAMQPADQSALRQVEQRRCC